MRAIRTLLFLFSFLALVPVSALRTSPESTWVSEIGIEAIIRRRWGGFGGSSFNPISQNNYSLSFTQAEFGWFQEQYSWSLGLGYRQRPRRQLAWGVNAFGDYGLTAHAKSLFQLGVGGELFGPCWVAHVNGYFPFSNCALETSEYFPRAKLGGLLSTGPGLAILDASYELNGYRRSYSGFDIEVGRMIDLGPGELWGFIKGFYYQAPHIDPIAGPILSVMYRTKPLPGWGAEIYFGGEWQWDRVEKSQGAMIAGVRVPLCTWNYPICGGTRQGPWDCWDNISRHMNWNVRRQPGVLTEAYQRRVNKPAVQIGTIVFANATGTAQVIDEAGKFRTVAGDGSQARPVNLVEGMGANRDILFLIGSSGNILGNITMINGQTIAGFGGQNSVTLRVQGKPLTITALPGNSCLANLDAVGGVGITLPSTPSLTNLSIQNIAIINSTTGISGSGFTNLLVNGVTVIDPGVAAVALSNFNGIAEIKNLRSSGRDSAQGIILQQTNGNFAGTALLTGNTLAGFGTGVNLNVSSNAMLNTSLWNNSLTGHNTAAISGTSATGLLQIAGSENTIEGGGKGILLSGSPDTSSSALLALFDKTIFKNVGPTAINVTANGTNSYGIVAVKVTNSIDMRGNALVPPYLFQQLASSTGAPLLVSFSGNSTTGTIKQVDFNNASNGVFKVLDFNEISTSNNGIVPTTSGTITNATISADILDIVE